MSASQDAPQVNRATVALVAQCMREMDFNWEDASRRASEALRASDEIASENIGFQRTDTGWVAVVRLSPVPAHDTSTAMAAIINDSAQVKVGRWAEVFVDPNLYLSRETKFIGPIWEGCFDDNTPPLHVDPESWVGAVQPYGEDGDWQVWVDGEMRQIVVDCHDLWGADPARITAKDWLSIEGETTGIVIRSDKFGCLWGRFSERAEVFFGRPTSVGEQAVEYLWELLSTPYTDCDFTVSSVECDSLDPADMLELVDGVGAMDPNHDDSETRVACEGFSGTTEGLRVQTLGDDESGAEDGEETEDDD
jgi:hypothetical protein